MQVAEFAPNADERQWGLFAHLSGMLAYMGVPFGGVLGPLIIYNLNKHDRPFAAEQGRNALNFHLTIGVVMAILLVGIISSYLSFFFTAVSGGKFAEPPVGGIVALFGCLFAFFIVYVYTFVLTIVGTVKASSGEIYRYPLTFEFVRK